MNLLLPPAAIIAGIYFVIGAPKVLARAVLNSLLSAAKAGQLATGVRFSGVMLVASGLVATAYNLATLQ